MSGFPDAVDTLVIKRTIKDQNTDGEMRRFRIAADILDSIDDYISAFDRNWNFTYVSKKTPLTSD